MRETRSQTFGFIIMVSPTQAPSDQGPPGPRGWTGPAVCESVGSSSRGPAVDSDARVLDVVGLLGHVKPKATVATGGRSVLVCLAEIQRAN